MWIEIVKNKGGKNSYKARIEKNGTKLSKTFPTRQEANLWGVAQEKHMVIAKKTIHAMFDANEAHYAALKGSQSSLSRLKTLRETIADVPVASFTKTMFENWEKKRLKQVSPRSVLKEAGMLKSMFKLAVEEGWLVKNPIPKLSRPTVDTERARGITQDEINELLKRFDVRKKDGTHLYRHGPQLRQLFILAIETAMRLSEMTNLTWKHVHEKFVHIPESKNDKARDVPLSTTARAIINERRGEHPKKVFTIKANIASSNFLRRSFADIHFHDTRSEAISRLAKKMNVYDLARTTGHNDLDSLLFYYKGQVIEVADKLG